MISVNLFFLPRLFIYYCSSSYRCSSYKNNTLLNFFMIIILISQYIHHNFSVDTKQKNQFHRAYLKKECGCSNRTLGCLEVVVNSIFCLFQTIHLRSVEVLIKSPSTSLIVCLCSPFLLRVSHTEVKFTV